MARRTRTTAAQTTEASDVELEERVEQEQAPAVSPDKVKTVEVTGRSGCPPTMPENKRYGHWRGKDEKGEMIHWPGEGNLTIRVPIETLDELTKDPWVVLSWNRAEEEIARANSTPDATAKSEKLKAAELELQAAEANARAAVLAAKSAEQEAIKRANEARARIEQIRTGAAG